MNPSILYFSPDAEAHHQLEVRFETYGLELITVKLYDEEKFRAQLAKLLLKYPGVKLTILDASTFTEKEWLSYRTILQERALPFIKLIVFKEETLLSQPGLTSSPIELLVPRLSSTEMLTVAAVFLIEPTRLTSKDMWILRRTLHLPHHHPLGRKELVPEPTLSPHSIRTPQLEVTPEKQGIKIVWPVPGSATSLLSKQELKGGKGSSDSRTPLLLPVRINGTVVRLTPDEATIFRCLFQARESHLRNDVLSRSLVGGYQELRGVIASLKGKLRYKPEIGIMYAHVRGFCLKGVESFSEETF